VAFFVVIARILKFMNITDDMERLSRLHKDGALSDIEFAQAKGKLLSQLGGSAPAAQDESFILWRRRQTVNTMVYLVVIALFYLVVFMYKSYH
jgi:hypothetical protein